MTASSSIHFTNKEIRLTQLRLKFTRKGQIMHFETLQVTLISAHTFISNVLIRQFIQSERGRSNINSMPLKTWLMYHKQKIRFLVQLLDFKSKETSTNAFLLTLSFMTNEFDLQLAAIVDRELFPSKANWSVGNWFPH